MKLIEENDELKIQGFDLASIRVYFLIGVLLNFISYLYLSENRLRHPAIHDYIVGGLFICLGTFPVGYVLLGQLFFKMSVKEKSIKATFLFWEWNSNGKSVSIRQIQDFQRSGWTLNICFSDRTLTLPFLFKKDMNSVTELIKKHFIAQIEIETIPWGDY